MFSEKDIKKILTEENVEKTKQDRILQKLKNRKNLKQDTFSIESKKLHRKIVGYYYKEYKLLLEVNKMVSKRSAVAERKIISGIIFQILENKDKYAQEVIKSKNLYNLLGLINTYLNIGKKPEEIRLHFLAYTSDFKNLLKNYFRYKDSINLRVKADIRDDILTIIHNHFGLIENIHTNVKGFNSFEKKLLKTQPGNNMTKLFTYLAEKRELKPIELSVFMFLYSSRKKNGDTILPQAQIAKKLNVSRVTVSKALKSLIDKGYISEVENYKYSYKKNLGKIYRINLEKLK